MPEERDRAVLIWVGLTAGALQVIAGVAMYLAGVYFAPWSIVVSFIVLLLCIVAGTRWYAARRPNGEITYTQALLVGVVISVSTGVVYALYNMISISFFYPNFLDEVARLGVARAAARGESPEAIAAIRVNLTAASIAIPNLIRLAVAGSILSLLTSLVLRTRK